MFGVFKCIVVYCSVMQCESIHEESLLCVHIAKPLDIHCLSPIHSRVLSVTCSLKQAPKNTHNLSPSLQKYTQFYKNTKYTDKHAIFLLLHQNARTFAIIQRNNTKRNRFLSLSRSIILSLALSLACFLFLYLWSIHEPLHQIEFAQAHAQTHVHTHTHTHAHMHTRMHTHTHTHMHMHMHMHTHTHTHMHIHTHAHAHAQPTQALLITPLL